jgi:catechol 2,3-dioxygenase-like lactoylglutathione lyase family enzyme
MFQVESIDHVALLVRDVEGAARWYQDVLGLDRLSGRSGAATRR